MSKENHIYIYHTYYNGRDILCCIGMKPSNDLIHYLDNNKEKIPDYVNTKGWREMTYVSYVYALILLVIAGLFLTNRIIFKF